MKPTRIAFVLALFLQLGWASAARADLIGATVDVAQFFPDTTTLLSPDPGPRVVSSAVEYPAGSYTFNPSFQVDVSGNQFSLFDSQGADSSFSPATFNGLIMTVLSGPQITSAVADSSSAFSPASISIVGNELQLNYQGVGVPQFGTSIIDITTPATAVPEPSSFTVVIIGAAGLVAYGCLVGAKKHAERV